MLHVTFIDLQLLRVCLYNQTNFYPYSKYYTFHRTINPIAHQISFISKYVVCNIMDS